MSSVISVIEKEFDRETLFALAKSCMILMNPLCRTILFGR